MEIRKCEKPEGDYTLTWGEVKGTEGIYQQTGNRTGHVLVIRGERYLGDSQCVALWVCGSNLTAFSGGSDDTRFRRVRDAVVCLSVVRD